MQKANAIRCPIRALWCISLRGGFQGQATDIEIHAKEILSIRERLNEIYSEHTGQPVETIADALERDKFYTPEDAKDFGLIDEVVSKRLTGDDAATKSDGSA